MYKREILNNFIGKTICIERFIDDRYKIAGTPQYNNVVFINGNEVYNKLNKENKITREEVDALIDFGKRTGQYHKKVNAYNRYNITYKFIVK